VSQRVHSRYQRRLSDTPSGCQEVLIFLRVRRFACVNQTCKKVTFAEQVPGLTSRYARRTGDLHKVLQAVAFALGGRAGARLSAKLACPVGRSTLLRLIRAAPDPAAATPLVLGVDDFAMRKGHIYGTVLVNIETHQVSHQMGDRLITVIGHPKSAGVTAGRHDRQRHRVVLGGLGHADFAEHQPCRPLDGLQGGEFGHGAARMRIRSLSLRGRGVPQRSRDIDGPHGT
jgi:hypothetical protein